MQKGPQINIGTPVKIKVSILSCDSSPFLHGFQCNKKQTEALSNAFLMI